MPQLEHKAHWQRMLAPVAERVARDPLGAGALVVLLPYAQLMGEARTHWRQHFGHLGAAPRFESTRNWATHVAAFVPFELDLAFNTAHDLATACQLLARAGLSQPHGRGRGQGQMQTAGVPDEAVSGANGASGAGAGLAWASRLLEAALTLAPVAAAQPAAQRVAWAQGLMPALAMNDAALNAESALGQLALTWVGQSRYATDALFTAQTGAQMAHLFVVRGFAVDPLVQALMARWSERVTELVLHAVEGRATGHGLQLHPCTDAFDEAECTAALVLQWVAALGGRTDEEPARLALVAQDRTLTRRVAAILSAHGVGMFDETGWMLSTTRAAANVMALLRAMAARVSGDEVLQAVKAMPAVGPHDASQLEVALRKSGTATWAGFIATPIAGRAAAGSEEGGCGRAVQTVQALRAAFGAKPRRCYLPVWLGRLCQLLVDAGQTAGMQGDAAFQQVAIALGLAVQIDGTWALEAGKNPGETDLQLTQAEFVSWVTACLEGATFRPESGGATQAAGAFAPEVCVLPLPQLLGRYFEAVVMAGCDERSLAPVSPPSGWWTAAQREALGLPSHDARLAEAAGAWDLLLSQPKAHVLWRADHEGAALLPSVWVQRFLLTRAQQHNTSMAGALAGLVATDPREQLAVAEQLGAPPLPVASGLLRERLSATAYQDLRTCPYRFYALRCLGLQEAPELDEAASKRDMGIWLHLALRLFHETRPASPQPHAQAQGHSRGQAPRKGAQDAVHADHCAQIARERLGLQDGDFLPFALAWPRLRDRYLAWLAEHESAGHTFQAAEYQPATQHSGLKWVGAIDRIDETATGGLLVIDYKAQSNAQVLARLKDPMDDVQLPFYAALLEEHALEHGVAHNLSAGYLSLSDAPKERVVFYAHAELSAAKDALLDGVERDFSALRAGAPLAALGAGRACQHCQARGLCRTDFRGGGDPGDMGENRGGGPDGVFDDAA